MSTRELENEISHRSRKIRYDLILYGENIKYTAKGVNCLATAIAAIRHGYVDVWAFDATHSRRRIFTEEEAFNFYTRTFPQLPEGVAL